MSVQEYYIRDRKITVEKQDDIIAVRLERMPNERDLEGAVEELDLGRPATRLTAQRKDLAEAFRDANYVFVEPSTVVLESVRTGDPPPGTTHTGQVYIDAADPDRILIDSRRIAVRLTEELSEDQARSRIEDAGLEIVRRLEFAPNLFETRVPPGTDPIPLARDLNDDPEVMYAEPSWIEYIDQRDAVTTVVRPYTPDDDESKYEKQWQWGNIEAEAAWAITRGDGTRVAVIDNGFEIGHEDLKDGVGDGAAYFRDDGSAGAELVVGRSDYPNNAHGTFCAGMAVARGDNRVGGCGAAFEAEFISVTCLPDQVGSQLTLARAVAYAADPSVEPAGRASGLTAADGADVISCSLGPSTGADWPMNSELKDAIDSAVERRGRKRDDGTVLGTPVFWAASNGNVTIDGEDGTDEVVSYTNTIAVGRSTKDDKEHGSAYGPELDLLAPGVDVYSTTTQNGYRHGTGTSYATPVAAGVAALMLSIDPDMTWDDMLWSMLSECDQIGGVDYGGENGHHSRYGYGRLNAHSAVRNVLEATGGELPSPEPEPEPTPSSPAIVGPETMRATDDPPTFEVNLPSGHVYHVEVATRAELFDFANHEHEQEFHNFYPMWGEGEWPPDQTDRTYVLPRGIWERLVSNNPHRLFYRMYHAADPDGDWELTVEDEDARSAPSIQILSASTGPGRAEELKGTITGPSSISHHSDDPPKFDVTVPSGHVYHVEVATRAELFDFANHEHEQAAHNFYPMWGGGEWPPDQSGRTYELPDDVWKRLLEDGPNRLFYRMYFTDDPDGDWELTVADDDAGSAPSIRLTGGALLEANVGPASDPRAENRSEDVRALKRRLIELGYDWLTEDDTVNDEMVRTIKLFQSIVNGRRVVRGDGRVDVPGPTYAWLTATNPPHWIRMPVGSRDGDEGFYNIEIAEQPDDDHEYGTNWMGDTIRDAGQSYQHNYRRDHPNAAPITVNDVSRPRGGNTPDHAGHETGLDCDLRLPRTNGTAPGGTTFRHREYDRDAIRAMLTAIRNRGLVTRIFFNDPELIADGLCTRAPGHDNHVHFEIKPPVRIGGVDREAAVESIDAESRFADQNCPELDDTRRTICYHTRAEDDTVYVEPGSETLEGPSDATTFTLHNASDDMVSVPPAAWTVHAPGADGWETVLSGGGPRVVEYVPPGGSYTWSFGSPGVDIGTEARSYCLSDTDNLEPGTYAFEILVGIGTDDEFTDSVRCVALFVVAGQPLHLRRGPPVHA